MAHAATAGEVRHKLQIHFDAHECQPAPEVLADLADDCDTLAKAVGDFPQADLRVVIEWNGRSNEYALKLTLILPNQVFVSSNHDAVLHAAFERSMVSLYENVKAYKDQLSQVPERRRAEDWTVQDVTPAVAVDEGALLLAVEAGDYAAFRAAIAPYEDPLRLRAGRWVERYPEVQARMGRGLEVVDVVEEVFLDAFEHYPSRTPGLRLGDWLESLIDPAVKEIARHPDEELENINMARSACEATSPPPERNPR
jgi:hypothetical protein